MTDPSELGRALEAVAAAFDALGVTWAIAGSLASAAHGEPRSTNDVDVVAALDEAGAARFVELLGDAFHADADAATAAVRDRGSFNLIDERSFLKIDVFVPGPGPLGVGQLDRRRQLDILPPSRPFPVLGPEDVVLQKLRWHRLGGETSERQWRDIVSVLRLAGATIDHAYLHAVAGPAGLGDALERALGAARGP
jgi:nucleotidyltransferase AbiEii toxin of type IV toxin-antitoxin system